MHVEFGHLLHQVLLKGPFTETAFTATECDTLNTIAASYGIPQVTDTPTIFDEAITSAIAFEIAKRARQQRLAEDRVAPLRIANALLDAIAISNQTYFQIVIGGPGHVNASPTSIFYKEFFASIAVAEHSPLFSFAPFVVAPDTSDDPRVDTILFRWDRLEKVMNEDTAEEVAKIRQREMLQRDDAMMILALCGDAAIDAKPYLEGLHGRGNVPWYLRRTRSVVSEFASTLQKTVEQPSLEKLCFEELSKPLADALWLVLSFRDALTQATRNKRSDRFASNLLEIARAFYGVYNRPQFRDTTLRSVSESDRNLLPVLVFSMSQILDRGLILLENCCESAPFVLHTD